MNQNIPFSHRSSFWVILAAIFVSGMLFSFKYFAKAFPLVHLDITMNRNEALRQAAMLAKKFNWGPENYKQATVFDNDDEAQNFIELEGGGKKAFAHILE
ncbi:MAG: hypothetical protein AB7R69_00175 [Candidatus Babeliales bacterium]